MTPDVLDIIEKYRPAKRDSLIPLLQDVQERLGYLSPEALSLIGQSLKVSLAKIYGVASFYNQFKFTAPGKYHIQVCRGTACHVKGSLNVLETITRHLKIQSGQTTKDQLFSLEVVACVGACCLAPVMCINGEYHGHVTPTKIQKILDDLKHGASHDIQ